MKNFVHKKDNDPTSAGVVTAEEYNSFLGELKNAVSDYFTLSSTDSGQLQKAMYLSSRLNFYHDTGTVNNVVLRAPGHRSPQYVYKDGMVIMFQALHANTGPITIKLEGMQAFSAKWKGFEIAPGGMEAGGKYLAVFHDSGGAGWDIDELTSGAKYKPHGDVTNDILAHGVPTGTILAMPSYVAADRYKDNYLACNGALLESAKFPKLVAMIGNRYGGGGDNSDGKHFALPDYRGLFLRGMDNQRGIDKNRLFQVIQQSANKRHQHARTDDGSETISKEPSGDGHVDYHSSIMHEKDLDYNTQNTGWSGGGESRPINMVVDYLIKYT